jgi:hypothetical protein
MVILLGREELISAAAKRYCSGGGLFVHRAKNVYAAPIVGFELERVYSSNFYYEHYDSK